MNELTPKEALKWLDGTLAEFHPRESYEDVLRPMKWMTINIVKEERAAFVGALKILLKRDKKSPPNLVLDLAVHHRLTELKPELEAVANAMEKSDGYPAYFREFVQPFRNKLEKL